MKARRKREARAVTNPPIIPHAHGLAIVHCTTCDSAFQRPHARPGAGKVSLVKERDLCPTCAYYVGKEDEEMERFDDVYRRPSEVVTTLKVEKPELLEVSTVTCGRVIDRLESAGWAERRDDPQDRRAKRLHLHAAAEPVLEQLGLLGTSEDQRAIIGLSGEEAVLLGQLLEKVIENLCPASGSPARAQS